MHNILIDSCFWFGLYDIGDEHHQKSLILYSILEFNNIIIPHPVLYETLNTRFTLRKEWMIEFNKLLEKSSTIIVSDVRYKEKALSSVLDYNIHFKRPMSLVDRIIRLMLEDVDLNINSLITYNTKDFVDLCSKKGISLLNGE